MQTVKKSLVIGIEAEGEFLRTEISEEYLKELTCLLSKPKVTYGEIRAVLNGYRAEILRKQQ